MSHFIVIARLSGALRTKADIDVALGALMLPYREYDGQPEVRPFCVFEPDDEHTESNWAEKTTSVFIDPSGRAFSKYEGRFQALRTTPGELFPRNEYVCPDGWTADEVSVSRLFPDYDTFMRDYVGHEARDPEHGVYGYRRNPNGFWDWYTIGGRWHGYFKPKTEAPSSELVIGEPGAFANRRNPGKVDAVRARFVDWSGHYDQARETMDKFVDYYVKSVAGDGEYDSGFDSPRENGFGLGLLACKYTTELTAEERDPSKFRLHNWGRQLTPGVDRFDVWRLMDESAIRSRAAAMIPIYCMVDSEGWHARAEMGWWGVSREKDGAESPWDFKRRLMDRLQSGDQSDWLVAVDCHI